MFNWWTRRRDRDLRDEIQAHLDEATRDRIARGESADEARAHARREFGNVAHVVEATRDTRGRRILSRWAYDVRYGARALARSPVFTLAAIVSLALGIGANTAIFAAADALIWRRLPVPDPSRIVRIAYTAGAASPATVGQTEIWSLFTYPSFVSYRRSAAAAVDLAGVVEMPRSTMHTRGWNGDAPLGHLRVALVSGNYFPMLGIPAATGRLFTMDDDRVPGGHPVVVMSAALWQSQFSRAPDVLGRQIDLNGVTFTVVGIAPEHFAGDWIDQPVDLWFPLAMVDQVWIERTGLLGNPNAPWLRLVGRLTTGTSREVASAAVSSVFLAERPPQKRDPRMTQKEFDDVQSARLVAVPMASGYSLKRPDLQEPLLIVAVIAVLVLLIACANVANLMLARATSREHEMATRQALGASRGRLVAQLLIESALVAAAGGLVALMLGWWGTTALARVLAAGAEGTVLDVRLDWRVFGFATLLSALTALLFGLAPARRAAGSAPASVLGRRSPIGRGARGRLSRGIVAAQITISLVLLVGAGLFAATLRNLRTQDLGLQRDQTLLVWVPLSETGMKSDAVAALFHEAQGRVAAIPGVISAGPSGGGIMGDEDGQSPVTVVGHTRTEDEDYFVQWNHVSPGFFSTVGMTLLAGRDVTEQDNEHTARVAVVNETMARQYWHTANVVGQRFGMRRDTGNEIEIIGVVRDAVTNSPREARHRMIYLPYRQDLSHLHDLCLAVRTSRDSASVAPAIRQALRSIDPSLPISSINSLDAQVDTVLADDRLVAGLSVAFGAIALLLTAAGLYGVTAYLTARRTTEIGVRMALGASRTATLLEVLRETAAMSAVGVLAGIPVALVAGRAIASRLFGIGPMDPVLIGVVALVLVAVAMIAALVPAWRAAHVSPMVALRSD